MSIDPRVSVVICAYNHGPYLKECLDSVIAQSTDFRIEALVAEDCSTDDTREVLQRVVANHPSIIKPIYRDKNMGLRVNGADALHRATGTYIALLDGDDYWTDPLKLQKQVNFLESHPECCACFHNATVRYADGRPSHLYPVNSRKAVYTLADILEANVIPTCSIMYRNGLYRDLPAWFFDVSMGDWSLHVLNAEHGDIGYLDEVMGVYRVHQGGVWSTGSPGKSSPAFSIGRVAAVVRFYEVINEHLGFRYNRLIQRRLAEECYNLVWAYQCEEDWAPMRASLWKALKARPLSPPVPWTAVLKYLLVAACPPLNRIRKRWARVRGGSTAAER